MPLNPSKGNMYEFITHTWNTIKGECYHDCSYCYMKRWGKLNPVRFDQKELKTDLGSDNFIFVGSSCDMFNEKIDGDWIQKTLDHCCLFENSYLFQTKNPERFLEHPFHPGKSVMCTTLESNRYIPNIMMYAPKPEYRMLGIMKVIEYFNLDIYITIEPIMDFDVDEFLNMVKLCDPIQVNIGADSGRHNLPEPSKEKLLKLIEGLQEFTIIHRKSNLQRLLK